ncbi:MAG: hypothetical protein JWO38_2279 [Gemmataceae bacterium]|nr:hypothetical protein [Gemmataceae bacterium]
MSSLAQARSHLALVTLLAALALPLFITQEKRTSPKSKRAALDVVQAFLGKNLEKAGEEELRPLMAAMRVLDPGRLTSSDAESWPSPAPLYVWAFGSEPGPVGCLVLERGQFTNIIPGTTDIRLTLFDHTGAWRAKVESTTGWRCYYRAARLESVPGIEDPVVVIDTADGLGPGYARQWYARIGSRFDLVRVENYDGATARNLYHTQNWRCGPPPPRQTARQWEMELTSRDRARVLRALVWLGGRHRPPSTPWETLTGDTESFRDADLARRARLRPAVATRLQELVAHGDLWERDAAGLALQPDDVPLFSSDQ